MDQLQNISHIDTSQQSALLTNLNNEITKLCTTFQKEKSIKSTLTRRLKQQLQQKQFYLNQKGVQQRKYKSLNLLVNQLQSGFEKLCLQTKSRELVISQNEDSKIALQNHLLREELIKLNQSLKEDERLHQFMKQLDNNKSSLTSFIKRSNFIQQQAESMAKLRSSISGLQNPNLQCRRKWHLAVKEKQRTEQECKIYKIQCDRQVELLKDLYEDYLERINIAKTKIVNFNQTRKQRLLTDYMVHQVSLAQQQRQQLQNQSKNLHFHLEQLQQQHQRILDENSQLNSFFLNQNRQEQSRLATKMRARIQELKDGLEEMQVRNSLLAVVNKRNANLEYVRAKNTKSKEANDYLELKQRNIEDGNFSSLDEKEIGDFFSSILKQRDQKSHIIKQRNQQMNGDIKELAMRMLLLESQVGNLEEIVKENGVENQVRRREMFG